MPNLYEIQADAQQGEAMNQLSREFGLTPQQTQAAVAALLPAISMGIKQSTATPEGLGNLFALMGAQPDLYASRRQPGQSPIHLGVLAPRLEVADVRFGS